MIVYKATNKVNGKVYIGITSATLEKRIKQHEERSRTQKHNYKFYNAIRKYGIDSFNFEAIDMARDQTELQSKEIYWIKYFNSFKNGYNSTFGGEGSNRKYESWHNGCIDCMKIGVYPGCEKHAMERMHLILDSELDCVV